MAMQAAAARQGCKSVIGATAGPTHNFELLFGGQLRTDSSKGGADIGTQARFLRHGGRLCETAACH
jgi:hypothetical protein